ncbi:Ada metal-binding domain-containing protein [Enterovibrio baiacu]|uniref:Ada metal-binding domain-containing protein n=1 Tax=Enterovibrio baiacu TaxID=2491023 RepID=UPI001011EBD8|nr:Ada metal-binding domain-containing protein [Enterovibrio baiacu]MBE1273467.1 DNA-3-methyladenine glycosylase 2 family protein [Enterovibrio baiacu]
MDNVNTLRQQARLSRDPRFDGVFYIGVLSTGIYCRPICPAPTPKEENIRYFDSAIEAAAQGFRPCLRCRPDSAPGSPAWIGKETTLKRALGLIQAGFLQDNAIPALAEKLGVTDRYLRKLFTQTLGCSPKQYALYQQILFSKKLLHETNLSVTDIAFAAGFNSVRRFNDCFQLQMQLSPTQVRRKKTHHSDAICLMLHYRPPFNWQAFHDFVNTRQINGVEWLKGNSYGRSFIYLDTKGEFTATLNPEKHAISIELRLDNPKYLYLIINRIKRIFDVDANQTVIDSVLADALSTNDDVSLGVRIPGVWNVFEAGVRALCGESLYDQPDHTSDTVSVLSHLVNGTQTFLSNADDTLTTKYFPTPEALLSALSVKLEDANEAAANNLDEALREKLIAWATFCIKHPDLDAQRDLGDSPLSPDHKDYALLRGFGLPDLALSFKGNRETLSDLAKSQMDNAVPWRSYLALTLVNKDNQHTCTP